VTCSNDNSLKFWNLEEGKEELTLRVDKEKLAVDNQQVGVFKVAQANVKA